HRSNIIISEKKIHRISENAGLHPVMGDMSILHQEGKLGIVQSVGYPDQNRSHFRSMDIWTSASSAEEKVLSGWLGRYFENRFPGFPENYPNSEQTDPIALTIGNSVSQTCQGFVGNFSMVVSQGLNLSPISSDERESFTDSYYDQNLQFLSTAIEQSNAYSQVIKVASDKGSNLVPYWQNNSLAQQLSVVARLISGGLKTRIYVVSQGGYDTHGNQVLGSDPHKGHHANLLLSLSQAISRFQEDLNKQGLEDRVLGMTFSEFGRRIKSNGGLGSDHGTAAPLMLFGTCVNPLILGHSPEIPEEVDIQEGIAMQYDFRSVYGSILEDWMGVEETEIKELLYEGYQHLPLLTCGKFVEPANLSDAFNYPNPFYDSTIITFESLTEQVRLRILDGSGKVVDEIFNKELREGKHRIPFTPNNLSAGNYYFYLQKGSGSISRAMVKL
ncbi:MAG: DUF1501 domain-containing protein, partial [Bacteroidota bacterium]